MLLNLATKIFGSSNERLIKGFHKDIDQINEYEEEYAKLSDSDLKYKTSEFRDRLKNGETEKDILHEAFAVVREASKRSIGLRHFDVQMLGGMVLNNNQIAEMHTGEGKTLVATLPVYLNAISGKGVHVVTVNDYLAQRDAKWMGAIYNFLGLSVGCIVGDTTDEGRKEAYEADVTYGTNNEFGFDYLRDNMKYRPEDIVQKPFNFAIVDEVDSILIDEARTPLIISGPSESDIGMYTKVDKIIPSLVPEDYDIDEKMKTVIFTDEGVEHVEQLLQEADILTDGELYDPQNISLVHHANQALRAHKMFAGDTDYIVKDGKVILIDEFTGRMMDGRRLSDGLHQAIEAKENAEIQSENQTLASITFQNYFRMYPKLSGMTGTALTEATEFMEIYKLGVVSVPSNVEVTRIDHDDKIYRSFQEKIGAIVNVIDEAQKIKQPVLIGTVSIEKSELLSSELKKRKIKHKVLNARHHEQESQIIAQAGQPSAVTIATNMAGRGTDIKLGGNLDMIVDDTVDPDLSEAQRNKAIDKIKAEIEINQKIVLEAGGLFVIGTERHESRRVDNQLRGRSGRQGDPGETIFFLSTQDDLMRIFSPDALEKVLGSKSVGLKEGESLTHPWLTKALQRAQARVEQQNFEMRKTLLKFDDVMNDQRRVIYQQRRDVMNSADITELVTDMRYDVIDDMVDATIPEKAYPDQWDTETLEKEVARVLHLDLPISEWAKEEGIADEEIIDRITDASNDKMKAKADKGGSVFLQIQKSMMLQTIDQNWKEHLLNLDHLRQGINLRAFAQKDPLNEYKTEAFVFFENMLDSLKENVVHDLSLVEINFDEETLIKMMAAQREQQEMKRSRNDPALAGSPEAQQQGETQEPLPPTNSGPVPFKRQFDQEDPNTWSKVGRNAPCPCGSGKKYKQCHGKVAAA